MMSVNLSDIHISSINGDHYRCVISGISKSEAINLMQNADLTLKKRNLVKHKRGVFTYFNL